MMVYKGRALKGIKTTAIMPSVAQSNAIDSIDAVPNGEVQPTAEAESAQQPVSESRFNLRGLLSFGLGKKKKN